MSRIVTRPIKALSEGIEHMSVADFPHRVIIRGHSEIAQLAAAFNMMSEKLENMDQIRAVEFVSNASHELKTPLSATMKILDRVACSTRMTPDPAMTREFLTDIRPGDRPPERGRWGDLLTHGALWTAAAMRLQT